MRNSRFRCLLTVFAILSGGLFGTAAWPATTRLEPPLSASQVIAIQNELSTSLSQVNARSFTTGTAKDLALASAIEHVALTEIRMNSMESSGPITSVIIAVTVRGNTSAHIIGSALGSAAVQISTCKASGEDVACDAAKEIARTVANEGTSVIVDAFVSAVTAAGGSVALASVALGIPQVTAAIPGSVAGHRYGNDLPPPPPPPACGNPSCS